LADRRWIAGIVVLFAVGCGGRAGLGDEFDDGFDAEFPGDVLGDATFVDGDPWEDVGLDDATVVIDAEPDVLADTLAETAPDARIDAIADTTPDVRFDAIADTTPDVRVDAIADTTPDVRVDAIADTSIDVRPDVATDTLVDAPIDSIADAPAPIRCGATTCTALTQQCCFQSGAFSCVANGTCGGTSLSCSSTDGCAAGQVCCFGGVGATCTATCGAGIRLCRTDAECPSGQSCRAAVSGYRICAP
jgi:Cys-rich repeat protein